MNKVLSSILFLAVWLASLRAPVFASSPAVVKAVLFYSPSCSHCHLVITETLPPLFEKYGDQLNIVGVDISQPGGNALFEAATRFFNIEQVGVPLLVVGNNFLIGSLDIPEKFPGMIDDYLAQGGVDWPPIPELLEAVSTTQPTETPETQTSPPEAFVPAQATGLDQATTTPSPEKVEATTTPTLIKESTPTTQTSPTLTEPAAVTPTSIAPAPASLLSTPGAAVIESQPFDFRSKFEQDFVGNSLSVIVMILMVLSILGGIIIWQSGVGSGPVAETLFRYKDVFIPLLCLIGIGVAGYLSYVETAQVEAVCGPVGDCNTVQQSTYARLFGFLPIGIIGMAGYVLILLTWNLGRTRNPRQAALSGIALFGMAVFGLLFSIYLTFLEPFVIGATCAWCLTSALIMIVLFWLSILPARDAWIFLKVEGKILAPDL